MRVFLSVLLFIQLSFALGTQAQAKAAPGEEDLKNLFIELGKTVNPAVVNIFTTQIIRNPYGGGGPFRGMPMDPFERFFEEFMGGGRPMPRGEQRAASLGSGFIIDENGLIITNFHVIQNATDIQVQLTEKSKRKYKAKVIGKDEKTDIALIKISYDTKLKSIPLGDSDSVQMGEWVAAFGNPFGHGHTMTKGIISAKERNVELENPTSFPFLQTDASINPGNSGGPLVNTKGEVIGVNSAIDQRAQGIGFAIPINVVKRLLPDLKSKGHVVRGFLGVTLADIDERMMKELGIKSDKGAFVTAVVPGSPAEKAGLQPYDIVTEYNGKEVEDIRQLMNMVAETKIGETIPAKVLREGKEIKLNIKITERNDERLAQNQREREMESPLPQGVTDTKGVGVALTDLTPTLARQLELPPNTKKGVVVIGIKEGSRAEQAGLQVGDIIIDVNKKKVSTVKEALAKMGKGSNTFMIQRGASTILIFMGDQ